MNIKIGKIVLDGWFDLSASSSGWEWYSRHTHNKTWHYVVSLYREPTHFAYVVQFCQELRWLQQIWIDFHKPCYDKHGNPFVDMSLDVSQKQVDQFLLRMSNLVSFT